LLARGTARSKEIALRLAVGASRWRIVRQLLCEGLLLAICGGLVGLIVSIWCNDLLPHSLARLLGSMNFSFVVKLRPDATVLAVTFLFCLIATMLFSLGPALKATKADLVNDLKQQVGEPARIGRFSRFFAARHISVMAQIALSFMLLFSSGLFFRGALKASGLNPGFVAAGDLVTELDFSLIKKDPADARRLIFAAIQRARDLPGVKMAAIGTMLPYGNFTNSRRIMSAREALPTDPLNRRLFVPLSQGYNGNIYLHVRLATKDRHAVAAFIPTMRHTLRSIDPDLPILSITPFVDLTEKSVGLWIVRLGALLFGVFGGIALILAVIGVYGVKAYAVACRTREIGIRMALGAHRRDIFALIMRQGALQTALAVSIGLLLSLAAGRVLAQILYQVSPSDPFALVASGTMLAAAALLACFFPARRATHVEPLQALRTE